MYINILPTDIVDIIITKINDNILLNDFIESLRNTELYETYNSNNKFKWYNLFIMKYNYNNILNLLPEDYNLLSKFNDIHNYMFKHNYEYFNQNVKNYDISDFLETYRIISVNSHDDIIQVFFVNYFILSCFYSDYLFYLHEIIKFYKLDSTKIVYNILIDFIRKSYSDNFDNQITTLSAFATIYGLHKIENIDVYWDLSDVVKNHDNNISKNYSNYIILETYFNTILLTKELIEEIFEFIINDKINIDSIFIYNIVLKYLNNYYHLPLKNMFIEIFTKPTFVYNAFSGTYIPDKYKITDHKLIKTLIIGIYQNK